MLLIENKNRKRFTLYLNLGVNITKTIYFVEMSDTPDEKIMEGILDPYGGYDSHFDSHEQAEERIKKYDLKDRVIKKVTIIIE